MLQSTSSPTDVPHTTQQQREQIMAEALEHAAGVPEDILRSLTAYILDLRPTGEFLRAVLSDELTEAVCRADDDNLAALPQIVKFIYNWLPENSWRSPEKVSNWLRQGTGRFSADLTGERDPVVVHDVAQLGAARGGDTQ